MRACEHSWLPNEPLPMRSPCAARVTKVLLAPLVSSAVCASCWIDNVFDPTGKPYQLNFSSRGFDLLTYSMFDSTLIGFLPQVSKWVCARVSGCVGARLLGNRLFSRKKLSHWGCLFCLSSMWNQVQLCPLGPATLKRNEVFLSNPECCPGKAAPDWVQPPPLKQRTHTTDLVH